MDLFTRFNQRNIQDRNIDTLIGLSKGLVADGKVNQAEAEFLMAWLVQNQHSENPIIVNLLSKVSAMLDDGVLDEEEAAELLNLLHLISGESSEIGEMAKPSSLPLCAPAPTVTFDGSVFLFTGTFAFGTRRDCQSALEALGGNLGKSVTKKLDYLVIGSYVTDSWAHESFGRKIEKAMAYRDDGVPLHIISESHWVEAAGL